MSNYYIDTKNKIDLLNKIRTIDGCKNLYLKIGKPQLVYLKNTKEIDINNLTIEIIENSKHLEKEIIRDIVQNLIEKRINENLLPILSSINYQFISLDFYCDNIKSLKSSIIELINKYPNIKHFSVYPNEENLYLKDQLLGFSRYHHNMWSKDAEKYYAKYDLETILDKQCISIDQDAVSREGNLFTKNEQTIELDQKYIEIQDHIDRLNYYLALDDEELKRLTFINAKEYKLNLEKYSVMQVHQELISNLFEA